MFFCATLLQRAPRVFLLKELSKWPFYPSSTVKDPFAHPGYSRWLLPPAPLAIHLAIGQVYSLCAEHVRQLEGESPFDHLMEVKS